MRTRLAAAVAALILAGATVAPGLAFRGDLPPAPPAPPPPCVRCDFPQPPPVVPPPNDGPCRGGRAC